MLGQGAIHLGDVPTWIAAIGTVGTLGWVVSLAAAQNVARRREERSAQARRVAAWIVRAEYHWDHDREPWGECEAAVRNDSRLPITDVGIELLTWAWYDTKDRRRPGPSRLYPAIPPKTTTNPVPFDVEPAPRDLEERHYNPPVLIEFYDANHRHWRRWPDGTLEEV